MLRLECSIDCVSGPPPKYFYVHFLTTYPHILTNKKKKINWFSRSPPMFYKLVLGPTPILHTNALTTFGISRHFLIILLILMKKLELVRNQSWIHSWHSDTQHTHTGESVNHSWRNLAIIIYVGGHTHTAINVL